MTHTLKRDEKAPLLTRPFVLCSISNLLQGIAFSLFLHVPGFLEELGAGPVVIGSIFAVTGIVAIAAKPGLGAIMDRRGRRGAIVFGNVLNVVVIALYLGIDSIGPGVYAVRVLHGLAEATLFTVLFTYAADHTPPSRLTEGLSIFGVSGMLPMSLGGALGDFILARWDFAMLFQVAWGFAFVALLAALPLRDDASIRHAAASEAPRGFMASLKEPGLLPVWWIASVFFIALGALFIFLKTYVMSRSIGSVGGFFTAYTVVAIALRIGLGWLPDRVGPIRILVPALLALSAGLFVLAGASTSRDVVAAGVLCGIGHGYTFPILFGLVVRRARDSERGSAMAIYTGLSDLGIVIAGPVFGGLLERWSYGVLFGSAAGVVLLGTALFVPWNARLPTELAER